MMRPHWHHASDSNIIMAGSLGFWWGGILSANPCSPGEAALLFLTGMCEYEIEGNKSFLTPK